MNDLASVDAAVLSSKASQPPPKKPPMRPEPVSTLLPPFQQLIKNEETNEAPLPETHTAVHCIDKSLVVPKAVVSKLPDEMQSALEQFPYYSSVFTVIANWCEKVGAAGVSPTPKPIPNAYTEFHLLCNDFEKELFEKCLFRDEDGATLIATTNAAEHYKMEGLLTFCIVAIGCCTRGKSEHQILSLFDQSSEVTEEEREGAKKKYAWLEDAMKTSS